MRSKSEIPEALADLALVDGPSLAAAGAMSISAFLEGVRRTANNTLADGVVPFPQPAIRRPRFTRFRAVDGRRWLEALAAQATQDDRVLALARRASDKAREPAAVAKARETKARNRAARNSASDVASAAQATRR